MDKKRPATAAEYIVTHQEYHEELTQLHTILTEFELTETIKWGAPCYTYDGKNIIGLAAFKSYIGLWFFQGALLQDSRQVLINAQEGKTKALRQWRLSSKKDIKPAIIKSYIKEAINLARQGKTIKPDRDRPLIIPDELIAALKKDKSAQKAFATLTKGRQREYAEYIADAKQLKTRLSRIKKILPMIIAAKGLNDKYKS